jgi:hypothetical protein
MKKESNTSEVKKIQFIAQSKGGSGKSVLAFLMALKFPKAKIMDMDVATQTTMNQVAFSSPTLVPLLNEDGVIDRYLLQEYFIESTRVEYSHIICDLGSSISEQLPLFFKDNDIESLRKLLDGLNISLELLIVVGGANIYKPTMEYLNNIVETIQDKLKIKVIKNNHFVFHEEQNNQLSEYLLVKGLGLVDLKINGSTNVSTKKNIEKIMASGNGLDFPNPFTKMAIENAVKDLAL